MLLAALEENEVDVDSLIEDAFGEEIDNLESMDPFVAEEEEEETKSLLEKEHTTDTTTSGGTTTADDFTVVNKSGDAFVLHEDGIQFGTGANGVLGPSDNAPTGFDNQGKSAGFFLDPENLGTVGDPIISGTPALVCRRRRPLVRRWD